MSISELLDIFKQISAIPRCSGHEREIAEWLSARGEEIGLTVQCDPAGNVVLKVPATRGMETAPGIILQGHMDMVCEKTPASNHDFSKDPIRPVQEGEWLKAEGTTLGADNGIGIALCLSLAAEKGISHPPLELLFTVEEETGLTGAGSLQPGFIDGRVLINVDSEEEGGFTVGSAGGRMLAIDRPVSVGLPPEEFIACRLRVSGLQGGHSGVDIHKRRGNANKILGGVLKLLGGEAGIRLVSITGGSRSNAIPRDAEAVIACHPGHRKRLEGMLSDFERKLRHEYAEVEPDLSVMLSRQRPEDHSEFVLAAEDSDAAIDLLDALPDGVVEMSSRIEGLVETSNNVATVRLTERGLAIGCFMRSALMDKLDALTSVIESLSDRAGAKVNNEGDFPPWEPNLDSPLLARCRRVYRDLFAGEPKVTVIHAGLECSIIGARYPGLDMISVGPTIENPHSPGERLHLGSVEKIRAFLAALIESYGKEARMK